jgi:hypothetical protein
MDFALWGIDASASMAILAHQIAHTRNVLLVPLGLINLQVRALPINLLYAQRVEIVMNSPVSAIVFMAIVEKIVNVECATMTALGMAIVVIFVICKSLVEKIIIIALV